MQNLIKTADNVLFADEISVAKDLDLHDMTTISSLESIQYLTNLQFLNVDGSSISDLTAKQNTGILNLCSNYFRK